MIETHIAENKIDFLSNIDSILNMLRIANFHI